MCSLLYLHTVLKLVQGDVAGKLFLHVFKVFNQAILFLNYLPEKAEAVFFLKSYPNSPWTAFNDTQLLDDGLSVELMQSNQGRVAVGAYLLKKGYLLEVQIVDLLEFAHLHVEPDAHRLDLLVDDCLDPFVHVMRSLKVPHIYIVGCGVPHLPLDHVLSQVDQILHVIVTHRILGSEVPLVLFL